MSPAPNPSRAEIWLVDLEPARGPEQRGTRPALVVSTDRFNHGPADLVTVLPLTKVSKGIPSHVPISREDRGLDHDSFVIVEQVRCISNERFARRIGLAPLRRWSEWRYCCACSSSCRVPLLYGP